VVRLRDERETDGEKAGSRMLGVVEGERKSGVARVYACVCVALMPMRVGCIRA